MNGKAVMNGLDLNKLDASDFLDVVHYIFEEDLFVSSKEEAEAKSEIRSTLYRNLYEREYKHRMQVSSSVSSSSSMTYADGSPIEPPEDDFSDISQFDPNPVKKEKKPFIPATDFNPESPLPFGKDIDSPLG